MALAVLSVIAERDGRTPRAVAWVERRPWAAWLGALAAFTVAAVGIGLSPENRLDAPMTAAQTLARHGLYAAVAAGVLLPAVFGPPGHGAIRRLLAHPVLIYLGTISYGIFLWQNAPMDRLAGAIERKRDVDGLRGAARRRRGRRGGGGLALVAAASSVPSCDSSRWFPIARGGRRNRPRQRSRRRPRLRPRAEDPPQCERQQDERADREPVRAEQVGRRTRSRSRRDPRARTARTRPGRRCRAGRPRRGSALVRRRRSGRRARPPARRSPQRAAPAGRRRRRRPPSR